MTSVTVSDQLLVEYLQSWLWNVGRSSSPDETVAEAMCDTQSLINWGFISSKYDEFDYNYTLALETVNG